MSQLLQFYKSFQQTRAPVVKAAPTFEDLTIDDQLSEHQRVVRYVKSTIGLQRLVHVKMLTDVAKAVGFDETSTSIIPLIEPLSNDNEPVIKQHLVEQLKGLAKFCFSNGGEPGYRIVLEQLLPITATLLEDEKMEVRQSASMTLVEIAQLIRLEDIGQHVLTIILRLAHEDDKEEMRMTASQLLNLLAESLGQDLCKQFVIPEVVSLSEDPVFRVRKSTALNFHNICKVGGEHELLERLMPAFVRLSKDDIYRVRRACAESLSEISKHVSEDIRLGVLVEIFLRLTQDPSKLVKQSVLQQSGMFIATLPSRAVNETILSHYCSMAYGPTGDLSVDADLKYICAYSFPAVLSIVGKQRWKEIREVYHTLAQSRSANIKQTLAYSLHEVARLLGEGPLVEAELVPVFEEMIQDQEAVQMGVIKHLAPFLETLPEPCRVSYLPLLHDILHSTNPFNWRLRQYLAVQLPALVLLPPKNELFRTVFPLVMILMQDPVASVRRDSFRGVTSLINNLYELSRMSPDGPEEATLAHHSKQHLDEIARAINSLVAGEKYQLRQLWVEVCHQLLSDLPRELFEHYFVQGILTLTSDTVCNVRVALAYFLVGWGVDRLPPWTVAAASDSEAAEESIGKESPWHWLLRRPDVRECVVRLSRDDRDVFLNVVKLQPLFPDVQFSSMSCRGHKAPPGGSVPVPIQPSVEATGIFAGLGLKESCPGNDGLYPDCLSDDGSTGGYSSSGYNAGMIADIHANSNRSSFSSAADEDQQFSRLGGLHGPVDMSAIDIDLVPRGRAASFPAMEYIHDGQDDLPMEIDEELDIIDGIIRASPKNGQVTPDKNTRTASPPLSPEATVLPAEAEDDEAVDKSSNAVETLSLNP